MSNGVSDDVAAKEMMAGDESIVEEALGILKDFADKHGVAGVPAMNIAIAFTLREDGREVEDHVNMVNDAWDTIAEYKIEKA